MLRLVILAALGVAACAPAPTEMPADATPAAPSETADRPALAETGAVAVVELFTSQGCSSCPPADDVLRDLADQAERTGRPIVPLSFHVDYWNRLGWADPYSDAAYTARQRAYARAGVFDDGRVFTPAMVVNGADGFVGSQRRTAASRVARALDAEPTATVRLSARADGRDVTVEYDTSAPSGAVLHLALVEDDTAVDVTRGENRGRRLAHARVVRAFETVDAGAGSATLRLPDGLDADGARVVGYVQPDVVGPVLGAAETRI